MSELVVEEKALDPKLIKETVVDIPKVEERQQPYAHPIILTVAAQSQSIVPWGVDPIRRDRELRAFWPTEPWLASVVYSVAIRNASFVWEVVGSDPSEPLPKNTARAVTRMLKNANMGKGWKNLLTKTCVDLMCLAAPTRVALGGDRIGKTKKIRDIVRDKDPGPVISVDADGKIVEQFINEWHVSPLGDRKWYWLSTKHASGHTRKAKGGLFLTEDHPMLTSRGWVQAKDITKEDKIATYDPVPSKEQAEIMVGGLLGDMSMTRLPKRALIRFSHSIDQLEYLEFKKSLFKGFSWTGQNTKLTKYNKYVVGVNSRASLGLVDWYYRWYPNGKKIVCREDVEKYFSPRMLSIWFMDDGTCNRQLTTSGNYSEHGCLFTNGFTKEDVEWLSAFLNKKGFDNKVQKTCDKYYTIRFSADGFRSVAKYIADYVHPSLHYKLGKNSHEYDFSVWGVGGADVFYDDVDEIVQRDYYDGDTVSKVTFHIGVENTHTFIANRLVSHNTQDNGAWWQLLRDGPDKPVKSIVHLDSGSCQRTGDLEYPCIYRDRYGREHIMNWWEIKSIEELPSPIENAFDLQYSAVSRCLLAAEIIQSIAVYKQEKVGGTFTRAIDIVSGPTQQNIDDGLKLAREQMLNRGMMRYSLPVIIPGLDPSATLSHIHLDLATLPDNFDEDTSFKWYVAQLAAAFGVDYQEIAPLMTGSLGSSQQSEIMHLKTHGKGPALFMGLLEDIINDGVIPRNVEFRFKEQDLRSESEKAEARFTRSKDRSMRVKSGELDGAAARRIAVADGDLPEWLADEIDSREKKTQAQGKPIQSELEQNRQEFSANQIAGGIETQEQKAVGKVSMADVRRLQKLISKDPEKLLALADLLEEDDDEEDEEEMDMMNALELSR